MHAPEGTDSMPMQNLSSAARILTVGSLVASWMACSASPSTGAAPVQDPNETTAPAPSPTAALPEPSLTSAGAVTSVYTDLGAEGCKPTAESEKRAKDSDYMGDVEGGDSECKSLPPYRIFMSYADMRSNLAVQLPGKEPASIQSYPFGSDVSESGFPYVSGKKLEWRAETVGGKTLPFALIYRVKSTSPDGSAGAGKEREYLQVVKVSGAAACLIGSVPATGNASANERAREVADTTARSATCPK